MILLTLHCMQNQIRESWQLELVFSGFVIFLLISGLGPYHDLQEVIEIKAAANKYFDVFQFPYHLIKAAYYLLLGTIILHVFFRGLWISTIVLRSVSGGIHWDQVNIAPRFKSYLNNDIKSFDDYINSIEQYCSLFFSFAFILVFSILAITLFGLTSEFTRLGIQFLTTGSFFGDSPVSNIIMLVYALLALIYLLDFISMGFVKRQKWLAPIYYPVYRYFGFITLAKFYRPIYYNLIDHRLGRRLILAIFPICLFTFGLMSLQYYEISYIQHNPHWFSDQWYVSDSYEDSGKESMAFYKPSIQSDIIENNHVKLFLPYIPLVHDPAIEMICPDLEPGYFKGLKMRGVASIGKIENWDSDPKELLRWGGASKSAQ